MFHIIRAIMDTFYDIIFPITLALVISALLLVVYIRYRQAMKRLGEHPEMLNFAKQFDDRTAKILKVTKIIFWAVCGIYMLGIGVQVFVLKDSFEQVASGLIRLGTWLMIASVQFLPTRFWAGQNGLVYGIRFIAWSNIKSIVWDKDIRQQSWGVEIKYADKDKQIPLRIWIPREQQPEAAKRLEEFSRFAPPMNAA